jgi:tetratricopeptide (TPR) repeat protein
VQALARSWQDRAFVHQETGKSKEPLWIVYGLLRGWLLAKISPDEQKDAHKAAGDFLVEMNRQDREGELGLFWVDCLTEARSQCLRAKELGLARIVTDRLSTFLERRGFYDDVRHLNAELLNYEIHPSPMNWIAKTIVAQGEYDSARIWYQRSIDVSAGLNQNEFSVALYGIAMIDLLKGEYEAARENFEKSLKINQLIGDEIGEAAAWHSLASIDLNIGNYQKSYEKFEKSLTIIRQINDLYGEAAILHSLATIDLNTGNIESAREKFEKSKEIRRQIGDRVGEAATLHQLATIDLRKADCRSASEKFKASLEIHQQIGNKAGEAATFHQLGVLANKEGGAHDGIRLIALSYSLFALINHADTQRSREYLASITTKLNYTKEQIEMLLREVAESYAKDRGQSLLFAAFPKA